MRVVLALCALLGASITTATANADVAPPSPCSGAGVVAIVEPVSTTAATFGPAVATATPLGASAPTFTDTQNGVELRNAEAGAGGCVAGAAPAGTRVEAASFSVLGGAIAGTMLRADLVPSPGDGSGWHLRSRVESLRVLGATVVPVDGSTVAVADWASLDVDAQIQFTRLAPLRYWAAALVVRLTRAHDGLPAGTVVLVGYAAANHPPAPPPVPTTTTVTQSTTTTTTTTTTTPTTTAAPPVTTTSATKSKTSTRTSKPPVRKRRRADRTKRGSDRAGGQPLTATPPLEVAGYDFPVAGGADWGDTYGSARSDVPGGWHHGDDLFAPLGTPVVAVADGTVFAVGWNHVGGWRLWLADAEGNDFYYAHLSGYTKLARNGARVHRGDVLGFVGNTGDAVTTDPHLHFEVHPTSYLYLGYNGAVDPTSYLRGWPLARHVHVLPPVALPGRAPLGFGSLTDFRHLLTVHPLPVKRRPEAPAKPRAQATAPLPQHRTALGGARVTAAGKDGSAAPVVVAVVLLAVALAAVAHTARVGRT